MKTVLTKFFTILAILAVFPIMAYASEQFLIEPVAGEATTIITNKQASNKMLSSTRYILFNNLDAFWPTYLNVLKNSEYSDVEAVNFTTDWFTNNKIADFDVFIFPMGNKVLNAADEAGTKVIDKINEILDAGKKVIIAGAVIYAGQQQLKDPTVETFLTERMGTQYLGKQAVLQDNTYKYFWAKGHAGDPVSISSRKFCNGKLTQQGGGNTVVCETPQIGLVSEIDIFKSKETQNSSPVDHFIWEDTEPYGEKLLGIKIEEDNTGARACLWSLPFQCFCDISSWNTCLVNAMRWMLQSGPVEDGPNLAFDLKIIDFGSAEVGKEVIREVNVMNLGNETLTISGAEFAEWAPKGTFSIVEGSNFPISLDENQQHTLRIKFKPATEDNFREYLDFTSNMGKIVSLELVGVGGVGTGSKIKVELTNNFLDFGKVEPNKSTVMDFYISNTGNEDLWIRTINLKNKDDKDNIFQFVEGGKYDTYILPGKTHLVKLRFSPREEKVYTDSIMIWSNAINEEYTVISIKGEGGTPQSVDENDLHRLGLSSFNFYPNPFAETANLSFVVSGSLPKMIEINLLDQSGKKIRNIMKSLLSPGDYTEKLYASALASGVYFVVISSDGQNTTLPIVISK